MFEKIDYVYAVYKEGNFTKAAQKLFISQPSLSVAVKGVEAEIGAPLFERSGARVTLTEVGREYIAAAEKIMSIRQDFEKRLGDIYGLPAIVADTHCIRICGRFGMYDRDMKDPTRVERIMRELIEPAKQSDFCHRIVQFGRDVCSARTPRCDECPLRDVCEMGLE